MKIQEDTICLHPWDMEIIVRYGGLKGFLDAGKSHREQTAMPFLPSVHQAVDVLCSENEEQVSCLRHNLRLRLLYISCLIPLPFATVLLSFQSVTKPAGFCTFQNII